MPEIKRRSITEAWCDAVRMAAANAGEITGLLVVVEEIMSGEPQEDSEFRKRLNQLLDRDGKASVETVSRTIFPTGLWNPGADRQELYERFLKILPKLRHCSAKNRKGHYFERLINFPGKKDTPGFNQLERIISTYITGNHRKTALQASLMNPLTDLTNSRRLGFPCLQQVAFIPNPHDRSLTVLGFYPMHYLFERAYGNYLGLISLGHFMATEMALRLNRMICVAGVAHLEVPQREVASLLD